ncbi:division/cell wall cluster transcriptional repressor MraZ [Candidatus Gottesmanbacteria bacterium RIFCSPLOWO2_02_FULL_40_10]|nr:MAG: division/cell wall cluster transcriptional repressor MraZ [Candidatus Gottesmanbacteria bacterium RIFCSPLOWO2_02_FULL_40_10]
MFLGTFEPNLMEKGRLALPKKIREELGGRRLVLTIGFDHCIFGFTEKMWETVTGPEMSRPLFSDKVGRDLRRKMFSEAISIELDSQGRFVIPANMIDFAQITDTIRIIGAGDHFEIWSKNKWEEYRAEMIKSQ